MDDRRARYLALLCGVAFLALAIHSALVHSGTCDELGAHIPAGYLYWTSGHFTGGIDNFPLGQLLIALPVYARGLSYELFTEQHLFLFRLPGVLMGALLGLVLYVFARDLGGRTAALVALALFAFCPNMLAHASVATLDLPTAFFILLALWRLLRYSQAPSLLRLVGFGLAAGAATAVKIQALLLFPLALIVLVFAAVPLDARRRSWLVVSWLVVPLLAVAVVCATYRHVPFHGGALLPTLFMNAVRGKLHHSSVGHFGYLLGRYSTEGWWYYFPLAIAVKTPIATLLLAAVGLVRRPTRPIVLFVLLPAAGFLAAGMHSRINIGLRHVLEVYPFIFILAGLGVSSAVARGWRRTTFALVGWSILECVWIAPHYLSYFNELAGGPKNGDRILVDSNYDWGQNDAYLRDYVARLHVPYSIDPEPDVPRGGRVIVNANALHGVLNGGERAYAWLKDRAPVARVAYTWFVYDLPGPETLPPIRRTQLQEAAQRHLQQLRTSFRDVDDPAFRMHLANALARARAYREAFDEIRGMLARDPTFQPALTLGGELAVRWKLGALSFEGDEYLAGFRPAAAPAEVDAAVLEALAHAPAIDDELGRLHYALGRALVDAGRAKEARRVLEQGLVFDGARAEAQALLADIARQPL